MFSPARPKGLPFKEQEKLHEEIIDSGLAKIYTAHLEIAKKIAADEGVELKTTLLAGKPFEQTMKYVNEVNPTLVVMGRIGYHSDDEMDIGGNTENMMRYLPTNVLVGNYEYQAPDLYTAEEHMTWTKEALADGPHPGLRRRHGDRRDHALRHREGLHGHHHRAS